MPIYFQLSEKKFAGYKAQLHPYKFYCQHYTKGIECLGIHIKPYRTHPDRRIIRNAAARIRRFRHARPCNLHKMLSSVNSYFGICKNTTGYKDALKLLEILPEKWRKYVIFDPDTITLKPKKGYGEKEYIIKKYRLK